MKREKEELIQDLLGDDLRRNETLAAGAEILRRRRHSRTAFQMLTVLTVVAAGFLLALPKREQPSLPNRQPVAEIKASAEAQAKALTDEELLALFPGTPVGLAKLPNGKKILIFPRPGDEQRFVTRL